MAVDKLIDSAKEAACRTAEANAIRAKTGGSVALTFDFSHGKGFASAIESIPSDAIRESKYVDLSMASGNQLVKPTAGRVLSEVVIRKPDTMTPANIKKDVNIGGVVGTLESGGGSAEASTVSITWDEANRRFIYEDTNGTFHSYNVTSTESGPFVFNNVLKNSAIFVLAQPLRITSGAQASGSGFSVADFSLGNGVLSGAIKISSSNASITITTIYSCFLPDTLITLADGSQKPIKDITYADRLKVWSFDTGDYDTAEICWLTRSGLKNDHFYRLTFSDGTVLCTTGHNSNHKVYNVDDRFFEGVAYIEVGKRVFTENGIVTLVKKEYVEQEVEYYNLITKHTFCCFANGVLTSDRYGNTYPIGADMRFIKDDRPIRPYSEFEAEGISEYWYDVFRLGEQTESMNSTKQYIEKIEAQMLPLPE